MNSDFKLRLLSSNGDLLSLYRIMNADDCALFTIMRGFKSFRDFQEYLRYELAYDYHDFFVVDYCSEVVGFVYNYDFSLRDGHCQIVGVVDKERRGTGLGVVATATFIKFLFNRYPLRKVYSTVYDYNEASLVGNLKVAVEEGGLDEYRYFNGKYWRVRYFSITREQFETSLSRYANVEML